MDRPARRPGPPVDAARLQPNNQDDIQGIDEGLVGAWLDDPDLAAELADELERLRRLQADEELLLALVSSRENRSHSRPVNCSNCSSSSPPTRSTSVWRPAEALIKLSRSSCSDLAASPIWPCTR